MAIRFEPNTFTAAQTEHVTGMSTMQQRNMRRLDHDVKSTSGHERRDARGLAKLLVMQTLSGFKVPPSASSNIADSASAIIVMAAARLEGATDDPKHLVDEPAVHAPPGFDRWYLVWDGENHSFVSAVDAYLASDEASGAAVILNLQSLAQTLLKKVGAPLWRVVEVQD